MKNLIILLTLSTLIECHFAESKRTGNKFYGKIVTSKPEEFLIRFHAEEFYEPGVPFGYRSIKGDTNFWACVKGIPSGLERYSRKVELLFINRQHFYYGN